MRPYFLFPLLLFAVAAQAQSVDITTAIERAIKEQPAVQASYARSRAAEGTLREARSNYLPQINFSETFSMTNEPGGSLFMVLNQERNVMAAGSSYDIVNPESQSDFEARLTIEQTLFDAETGYRIKEANKRLESAQALSDWSREATGFAAFQAYLGVQNAEADLQTVISAEKEASELLRLAKERYLAGIGLKADELRARVFLAEAERRSLSARNNLTIARRRLTLAVGEEAGETGIASPLDSATFPGPEFLSPAAERADLIAAARHVESLDFAERRNRAAYLPRLGLSASYGLHKEASPFGADGEAWRVGAALNWELFDGFRRSAGVARKAAEKSAAVAELSDARREQNFRRAEVALRIEEARAQKASAVASVEAAREGQRLLQQRYESGLVDLAELLSAQSALDQARSSHVAADTRLLFSLGQALLEEGRFVSTFLANREVSP